MTSEKLYEILGFLDALDKKLKLQQNLESVAGSLSNLVNQPATPQYQSNLATALGALEKAASQLVTTITPSQYDTIESMGGGEFFEPEIADRVKTSVQQNAMTPSVARDFVQGLSDRRSEFLTTIRDARKNLESLHISASPLQPGSADAAFLIPREIFSNDLSLFAKELSFISRLLGHYGEAVTGEAITVELEQLSSSVPTVAVIAHSSVIAAVAFAVNKFLEAWERIEKIRKLRAEIVEMGMGGTAEKEMTERIESTVEEVVEETTTFVLSKYPQAGGRKNELVTGVRQDTKRLFGQIERGLTVEFRAQEKKDATPEEQSLLADISKIANTIQFPAIPNQPMLLGNGEILEGEIKSRKTTIHKSATSKKGTPKESETAKETS